MALTSAPTLGPTSAPTSPMTGRAGRRWAAVLPAIALAATFAVAHLPDAAAQQPKKGGAQAAPPAVPPPASTGPYGVWVDHSGRSAVEIAPCAPAVGTAPPPAGSASLCGRIVWLQNPNDEKGQPLRDTQNKNATKRGGPICGLQIIGDVKPQANGTWDNGWIYDPEEGSQFDVELTLKNPETLQVKGYMGVKFLSETYVWRRAKEMPQKCTGA